MELKFLECEEKVMSKDEALGRIILDYCRTHNLSISAFARQSNISKGYISKITNNENGKWGVSSTIKELIANGMKISTVELEQLIEQYQETNQGIIEIPEDNVITKINNELKKFNADDLEIIYGIITNSSSEKLEILHNLLKNMK